MTTHLVDDYDDALTYCESIAAYVSITDDVEDANCAACLPLVYVEPPRYKHRMILMNIRHHSRTPMFDKFEFDCFYCDDSVSIMRWRIDEMRKGIVSYESLRRLSCVSRAL